MEEKPQYRPCDSNLKQDIQRTLDLYCSNHRVGQPCASVQGMPSLCLLLENCYHLSHSSPAVAAPSVAVRALHPGAGMVRSDQTSIKKGVSLLSP